MITANLPSNSELMYPTLLALAERDEPVHHSELFDIATEKAGLTAEQTALTYSEAERTSGSKIEHRMAWARTLLKRTNAAHNPKPGFWVATDLGREISAMPEDGARAKLNELEKASRPEKAATTSFVQPTKESRSAWLVRPGRPDEPFLEEWLEHGYCAIGWVEAAEIETGLTKEQIKPIVETAYADSSAGFIRAATGNVHRFLTRMSPGDLVVSPRGQDVYVGVVTGDPTWHDGVQPRRRTVDWANIDTPFQRGNLSPSAYSKLRTLLTVSDVTDDLAEFATIAGLSESETAATTGSAALLKPATDDLANANHVPVDWLNEIIGLLDDKRQVVFYGPPGTGKTYLAQQLADYLTDSDGITIVQFHPSYAYEDFFEGFRPQEAAGSGGMSFELVPGPLRRIADAAREDPDRPYILIIDEINRANIAKVFGELYFLLEYRDSSIALQYSGENEFNLPDNLFIIGTMNTADRSIAFIDAAMRRRFYFVPFFPRREPISGVLAAWLEDQGLDELPARLLDELNNRIADDDFSVGPSYLMSSKVVDEAHLARVWDHAIVPLLEEHFFGTGRDVIAEFGLDSLKAAIESPPPELEPPDA